MTLYSYRDMIVWQKSMDLVVLVYQLVKSLPKEETFALASQMRRSVVSIPSNIAEGKSRKSLKEFTNFLSIARGSVSELETQLYICEKVNYLPYEKIVPALELSDEIGRMLSSLISKFANRYPNL